MRILLRSYISRQIISSDKQLSSGRIFSAFSRLKHRQRTSERGLVLRFIRRTWCVCGRHSEISSGWCAQRRPKYKYLKRVRDFIARGMHSMTRHHPFSSRFCCYYVARNWIRFYWTVLLTFTDNGKNWIDQIASEYDGNRNTISRTVTTIALSK